MFYLYYNMYKKGIDTAKATASPKPAISNIFLF